MKKILFTIFALFSVSQGLADRCLEDVFAGSLYGCAIGDAMGKPTEFLSLEKIFKRYPAGIKNFSDFRKEDFWIYKSGKQYAPYTDDTAMAILVFEQLIKAKEKGLSLNETMGNIAKSFVIGKSKPFGWAMPKREPGNACLKGASELENRIAKGIENWGDSWWIAGGQNSGGCGAVMRAFPFGLVFHDDLQKAEQWSVAHSKLTHGAPISLAACAAMSVGVALSVQKEEPDIVIEKMIEAASRYDKKTADMMRRAVNLARKNYDVLASYGITCVERIHDISKPVFEEFEGWAAHDAIAAAIYIYALVPNRIEWAVYLGVHTPGDSDSIACMAGALVGARVGVNKVPKEWIASVEKSKYLEYLAKKAAFKK